MRLYENGVYLVNGTQLVEDSDAAITQVFATTGNHVTAEDARKKTIAYQILQEHNSSDNMQKLNIKFDSLASHDITYVGIIQTARASGLERFPVPYVLTNCHNSLCAVGGTINEDDHMFGLSCAKKYGGIYVPAHQAVIHQYVREMMTGGGRMILGSDSHTRYGALGTMAMGEGGPELVKQLLNKTYDIDCPEVIAIYLKGKPQIGVGPQDVALSIIGEVFKNGYVKNKVMEFVGPGVDNLSAEYRIGIDVMTTETTCLSSIWKTDSIIKDYYEVHHRVNDYKELNPGSVAYYDGCVEIDLADIKPMIAMPFHPSNVYTIDEFNASLKEILHDVENKAKVSLGGAVDYSLADRVRNGKFYVDQGVIGGCAGGEFENICIAADILDQRDIGSDIFTLNVYPASTPIYMELLKNGAAAKLMKAGAVLKTAFCGPCFGAGDTPGNNGFSIRHNTRNFPNREGSKLQSGQIASVALMDSRSIAATAVNKGYLTPATELDIQYNGPKYFFDSSIYANRVFDANGAADASVEVRFGPNIKDWPEMHELPENLILKVVSEIHDPVTTTDELIPSGETSSLRSNPIALSKFALSRKDPKYVGRAKEVQQAEEARVQGAEPYKVLPELEFVVNTIRNTFADVNDRNTGIGSTIFAVRPGDGSAREQAASCQKVLGGWANIANEYATKRYRSNLINWGMIPFIVSEKELPFHNGSYIFVPGIKNIVQSGKENVPAYVVSEEGLNEISMKIDALTDDEREIILRGCLINYYKGV